jgi:protein-tyrosine phosphatase
MAEGLIRERLEREGLEGEVQVASCGTWTVEGVAPTDHAVTVMSERDIDISDGESAEVDAQMVADSDLILVMTDSHLIGVTTDFPEAVGKTKLVSALAGSRYDIADPVGGSLEDYRSTADELARLIDAGWSEIVGG